MKHLIVIGANSAIAKEAVKARAPGLARLALCARDRGALDAAVGDLTARHPHLAVRGWVCDILDVSGAPEMWREMVEFCGRVDEVLVAPGVLGDQGAMEACPIEAFNLLQVNSSASTVWVLLAANTLERQHGGTLAVVTSVAGGRGRRSNYIYGSSKAQLIALLEGLRCRLAASGARLVDFRPGMVSTPMTAHLKKGPLMASSARVGRDLANALEGAEGVVYSPGFWRGVMFAIKRIPYRLFKKMTF